MRRNGLKGRSTSRGRFKKRGRRKRDWSHGIPPIDAVVSTTETNLPLPRLRACCPNWTAARMLFYGAREFQLATLEGTELHGRIQHGIIRIVFSRFTEGFSKKLLAQLTAQAT